MWGAIIKFLWYATKDKQQTNIDEGIPVSFDVNPDCSGIDLWNSFTIVDAIELIADSFDALKSKTVNACWKAL